MDRAARTFSCIAFCSLLRAELPGERTGAQETERHQHSGQPAIAPNPAPGAEPESNRARDDGAVLQPVEEVLREASRGSITGRWVALEAARADCLQVPIQMRRERPQLRRGFLRRLFHDVERVVAHERRPAGEKLEQNRAQTVDISRGREPGRRARRPVPARCSRAFRNWRASA